MENGYHLYDFKGTQLREEHVERFKQWLWRPRPPTLLSKDEQKQVRKNLREYSRIFEEQDQSELDTANLAVVETRRRLLSEWVEWRKTVEEELREERRELDLVEHGRDGLSEKANGEHDTAEKREAEDDDEEEEEEEQDAVIEEIVEEIVEESEEIVT